MTKEEFLQLSADDMWEELTRRDRQVFEGMAESVLREKGVRSVKAALALMDLETAARSDNVREALEGEAERLRSGEGAFLFAPVPTGEKADVGGRTWTEQPRDGRMQRIRRAAGLV